MTTTTRRTRPSRIKSVGVGEKPPLLWRLLLLEPRLEEPLELPPLAPEFLEPGPLPWESLPEELLAPVPLPPEGLPEEERLPELLDPEDLEAERWAPEALPPARPDLDLYSLANV